MAGTVASPERGLPPEPHESVVRRETPFDPTALIRGTVRNTPWIVIAVVSHVILFAVLSVWYVATQRQPESKAPETVKLTGPKSDDEPPVALPPPEIVPRESVPPLTETVKEGPVNPNEMVVPDADPGRPGEVTANTDPNRDPGEYNPDPEAPVDRPSGSTGGTSIGVGKIGHVGKSPSAYLSRVLGGGGKGDGGIGQEGGNGPGGVTKATQESVLWALRWLKNHQSPDGRWDCDGFDAMCKFNKCDGAGDATNDVGVSGLALLCFLGKGETHQSGSCRETVKNGLKWLRDNQDSEGCFAPRTSQHFMYNHACAALAMSEAYGMTGSRIFKAPAENGVGFVLKSKNPYLAWRYAYPADGDNDVSVTGWMAMVLKSAALAEIPIERGAMSDALNYVEKMTEPEFGRTGYQQRGGLSARTLDMEKKFPNDKTESMTAVGLLVRIFAGRTSKDDPMIKKGADLLLKKTPEWDRDKGTIDFYYWYYGTLAMFQVGNELGGHWTKWNEAIKKAVIDHQRTEPDRCERGSWDPVDCWSNEGGRVYATALNCLCMEVYYRYSRVMGLDLNRGKAAEKK